MNSRQDILLPKHTPDPIQPENSKLDFRNHGQNFHQPNLPHGEAPRIMIHYHKTGYAISYALINKISKIANIPPTRHRYKKRSHNHKTKCPNFDLQEWTFSIFTAPNLFCNANELLPLDSKIVHFVRDPFDIVISSYLYHSQTPSPESWEHKTNPCAYSDEIFDLTSSILNLSREALINVVMLCEKLLNGWGNHGKALHALDQYDGLRLDTARSIISNHISAGGDILRMPNNIKRLEEGGFRIMSVRMKDWIKDTSEMTLEVLDFLFENQISAKQKKEIQSEMIRSFDRSKLGNHVTQAKISKQQKQEWKNKLANDEILGPILSKAKQIFDSIKY